jgi:peptidyl-prolyl cis-trans isomerase B (cyclophilin B)
MIQGGGYDANFDQKEAKSIKGEFRANGVKNDLKHERGVLSMARTSAPNSASSQFFIMHMDAPHLDGQYAAFGALTSGIEVVDKIASLKTDYYDCPREVPVIEKIEIL